MSVARIAVVSVLVLAVAVLAFASESSPTAAETYKVDASHASVGFKIKHLDLAWFHGVFYNVEGTVVWNKDDLSKSSLEISVPMSGLSAGNEKREQHLHSPDFFNSKKFDKITFKSKKVESAGENKAKVTGDFTLHGVTKEITIEVVHTGARDAGDRFGYRAGWESTFTIKRSDYGIKYGLEQKVVGDEIVINVSLNAVRQ